MAIIFIYPKCLSCRQYFTTTPPLWTQRWNMTQIRWPYGCVGSLRGKSFGVGGEVFSDIWNLCSHWLVGVGRGCSYKCLSLVSLWAGCPGVKTLSILHMPEVTLRAVSWVWYQTVRCFFFFFSCVPCVLTCVISSYQHCYQVWCWWWTPSLRDLEGRDTLISGSLSQETYWSPGQPGLPCLKTNKVHHDSKWYFNPILLFLWHIWTITHCFLLEILVIFFLNRVLKINK